MNKFSIGVLAAALASSGGCKKKDSATGNGSANGSAAGTGSATGTTSAGGSATGGTNFGTTTNGTTASTQKGCVTKLGSDIPQGDIKLTAACGPVTVEGEISIDAKLTIEPGVTLSFVDGASLALGYTNASSLIAQGTAEKPITFTAATTKTAGSWKGIRLWDNDKRSVIDHVVVEFAGADGDDGAGIRTAEGVKELTVANSEFRSIKGIGLRIDGEHSLVKVEGNTFKDTSISALRINSENLPELGANNYGDKVVEVSVGRLDRSATLRAPATYRLLTKVMVERAENNQPVPVLTIEPGVVVESVADAGLTISYNNAGSLVANGTAEKPIKFTGFDKKKGSWSGIQAFSAAEKVSIQNAIVEYASSEAEVGAIRIEDNVPADIENVTFAHLDGVGVSQTASAKLTTKNLEIDDAKGALFKPAP